MAKKKPKPILRIIGDVHGKYDEYVKLAKEAVHSLQIGDMGFHYNYLSENLDPDYHKVFGGNHDNYTLSPEGKYYTQTAHFLGDFGQISLAGLGDIYYIRGGRSIDAHMRVPGVSWWPHEELDNEEAYKLVRMWEFIKPDFVVSHECPTSVIPCVSRYTTYDGRTLYPSRTAMLLQQLYDIHQPSHWIFGHYHKSWVGREPSTEISHETTVFRCLKELEVFDINEPFSPNKE